MNSATKRVAKTVFTAGLLLMTGIAVSAADWRLAVPTSSGLGLVDPQAESSSAVQIIGPEFGEIDEVIPLGVSLMGSISPVGTSNESVLSIDTRSLAPTGTSAIGNGTFGLIANQTITAPDGKSLYLGTFDGFVQQVDLATGKVLAKVELGGTPFGLTRIAGEAKTPVAAIKTESDIGYLLSVVTLKEGPLALDKKITLGDEKAGDEEIEYKLHVAGNTAFVIAPGHVYAADLTTSKVKRIKPVYNKKALTAIGSTADGKYLICRIGDGTTGIFVYDISKNTVVKRILMKGAASAVGSTDGSSFYVSSPDKSTIGVFDAAELTATKSFIVRDLVGPVKVLTEQPVSDSVPVPVSIGGNVVVYCDAFLGGSETSSFASSLSKALKTDGYGIPVINSANPDTEAANFQPGFADSVISYNPKIVVIELGQTELTAVQDALAEVKAAQAEAAQAAVPQTEAAPAEGAPSGAAVSEATLAAAAPVAPVQTEAVKAAVAAAETAQADAVKAVKEALTATVNEAVKAGLKVIVINPVNDGYKAAYDEVAKAASVTFVESAKSAGDNAKKVYPVLIEMIKGMAK